MEDRYRLNDTVYVCNECHNEYTNREVARRELKKSHLNNIFDDTKTDFINQIKSILLFLVLKWQNQLGGIAKK